MIRRFSARYSLVPMAITFLVGVVALRADHLDAPTLMVHEYENRFLLSNKADTKRNSNIFKYLKINLPNARPEKVKDLSKYIIHLGHQYRIDPGLIVSVAKVESNFNPIAQSPKGALGLMQIMPETAAWIASRFSIRYNGTKDLFDEKVNLKMGAVYLSYLQEKYSGDLQKMLQAYNVGPAKVDQLVADGAVLSLNYYNKVRQIVPVFVQR